MNIGKIVMIIMLIIEIVVLVRDIIALIRGIKRGIEVSILAYMYLGIEVIGIVVTVIAIAIIF